MTDTTTQPNTSLSDCHHAPVTIGGVGDFDDKDKVRTHCYVCQVCDQPCNLAVQPNQRKPETVQEKRNVNQDEGELDDILARLDSYDRDIPAAKQALLAWSEGREAKAVENAFSELRTTPKDSWYGTMPEIVSRLKRTSLDGSGGGEDGK